MYLKEICLYTRFYGKKLYVINAKYVCKCRQMSEVVCIRCRKMYSSLLQRMHFFPTLAPIRNLFSNKIKLIFIENNFN